MRLTGITMPEEIDEKRHHEKRHDAEQYDALLLVSFGGPEGQDDVIPFLENVLRGKRVPRERMLEVAGHYRHFGGVSPINALNRDLIKCIRDDFARHNLNMPVYFGNRNWHPLLPDTLRQMKADGVKSALAFFTSIYSCYSGCRQYRENIVVAREEAGPGAPQIHKLRMPFNHPDYVDASASRVRDAVELVDESQRDDARVIFTAHSIPISMAENCDYEKQLRESCRLIMQRVGPQPWELVYQSRSGPPTQPWLEPDVCEFIRSLVDDRESARDIVIMPVGFVSDHMEVLFDLDTEAADLCRESGINMVRARTVGTHPRFVSMVRQLVLERTKGIPRRAVGDLPPWHDVCPKDCCKYEPRRPVRTT